MTVNNLDKTYWEQRYKDDKIGWNIGHPSTPIKNYIDQLTDKEIKILIPGAGNGYEAEYLWQNGFKNVYLLDIAEQPLLNFRKRLPEFPIDQILHSDFFDLNDTFDLIIEQTFFCALDPLFRSAYVKKMHQILKPKGKLVGLLFNFPLTDVGPPFGGDKNLYQELFSQSYSLTTLEMANNSIIPRQGKELFFIFEKKE
ncbi:methyltransferase domain-containing protein [Winogradskyella poriferorum]|uniref:methyltransferase domain-containing protein n=1 Tax=Winogradskyella poriferorum TaxID=307627 RepID=UPI003D64921B